LLGGAVAGLHEFARLFEEAHVPYVLIVREFGAEAGVDPYADMLLKIGQMHHFFSGTTSVSITQRI
jgi:hypothetical protein